MKNADLGGGARKRGMSVSSEGGDKTDASSHTRCLFTGVLALVQLCRSVALSLMVVFICLSRVYSRS